jgi:hypothetical protein
MSKTGLSGREVGEGYLVQIQRMVSGGKPLPTRNGDLDMKAIEAASGVPRQSLYKHPAIRALLDEARKNLMPAAPPDVPANKDRVAADADAKSAKELQLERKAHRLEQQNAALVAENYELRRERNKLKLQLGRQDMTIETGRRIVASE